MVVGGEPWNDIFRAHTELWDLDSFENEVINPALRYYEAPGLFLVDLGYCSKD